MPWLTINDFSPGIVGIPGLHPPGSATEEYTYQCLAAEGVLLPAPRLAQTITHDALTDPEKELRSHGKWYISGLKAAGPAFSNSQNTARTLDLNRTELYFGFEWYQEKDTKTTNSRWFFQVEHYRRNKSEGNRDWEVLAGWPDEQDDSKQSVFPSRVSFDFTRANPSSPDEVGAPIVAIAPYRREPLAWPNPSPGNTNSGLQIIDSGDSGDTDGNGSSGDSNKPVEELVAHQGRLVLFPLNPFGAGSSDQIWSNSEGYYYTKVNDPTGCPTNVGFFDQIFGMEEPSGFATAASLTADELLIIKRKGGGLLLRGDLDEATVVSLPNLKSPGFAQCKGTQSPLGFAYAVENGGVWVWTGGDVSKPIAQRMRPDFWRPVEPSDNYEVAPTTMTQWAEWICTPNNFLFDTITLAWWKLYPNYDDDAREPHLDGTSFCHMDNDHNDRWCYFTPRAFHHGDLRVCYEFDQRLGATHYSWNSHPFPQTSEVDRKTRVKQIALTASGFGKVTVIVKGRSGEQTPVTFEVDNDFPTKLRRHVAVSDTHVQVRIQAWGRDYNFDGNDPAPRVHGVALEVEGSHLASQA